MNGWNAEREQAVMGMALCMGPPGGRARAQESLQPGRPGGGWSLGQPSCSQQSDQHVARGICHSQGKNRPEGFEKTV